MSSKPAYKEVQREGLVWTYFGTLYLVALRLQRVEDWASMRSCVWKNRIRTGRLHFHLYSVDWCHPASISVYDNCSPGPPLPSPDLDRKNPRESKAAKLVPEEELGPSGCSTASLANEEQGWKEPAWGWGCGIAVCLFLYNKRGSL